MPDTPQYTKCVKPADYEAPGFLNEIVVITVGFWAALATGGLSLIATGAAGISAAKKVCSYLLGGKLVCLGGDRCAIGWVSSIETVRDKGGFLGSAKIDNDFCLNLVLAPHALKEFAQSEPKNDHRWDNYQLVVQDHMQGVLITEQPGMPIPSEASEDPNEPEFSYTYNGYSTSFPYYSYYEMQPPAYGAQLSANEATPIIVPVLHCEIEGNRTAYVCEALNLFPPDSPLCHIPGIGPIICDVLSVPFFLFILAAAAAAWALGSSDNRDNLGAGVLSPGDPVVVIGRWVYDAAHAGFNEIHGIKKLIRLRADEPALSDKTLFPDFLHRTCGLVEQIPTDPNSIKGPGMRPVVMTPAQQAVYQAQQSPENQWYIHPLVDGCTQSVKVH